MSNGPILFVLAQSSWLDWARIRPQTGCPTCSELSLTPMKYIGVRDDAFIVGCSAIKDHHTRHWKCNKLFYEIDEINRGVARPIRYDEEALKRQAPDGTILDDVFPQKKTPRGNSITCAYENKPGRSQGHRSIGNKNCSNKSCQSCCRDLGPLQCNHHGYPSKPGPVNKAPGFSPNREVTSMLPSQSQRLTLPSLSQRDLCLNRNRIDVECAQAGSRSVGKELEGANLDAIESSMIQRGGKELRDEVFAPAMSEIMGGVQLITIYCWFDEKLPHARTVKAKNWPDFRLDEHTTFIEEVVEVMDKKWNRQLMVWDADPDVNNWREIYVDYNHTYPREPPIIVCRLQKLAPKICIGLSNIIEKLTATISPNGDVKPRSAMNLTEIASVGITPNQLGRHEVSGGHERIIDLTSDDEFDIFSSNRRSQQRDGDNFSSDIDEVKQGQGLLSSEAEESEEDIIVQDSQLGFVFQAAEDESELEEMTPESLGLGKRMAARRSTTQATDMTAQPTSPHQNAATQASSGAPSCTQSTSTLLESNFQPATSASRPSGTDTFSMEDFGPKPMWPTRHTLLCDLLSWHDEHLKYASSIIPSWRTTFGDQFDATDSTMYAYGRFVKRSYQLLKDWESEKPGRYLAAARRHFAREYQSARHLKPRKRKHGRSV